MKGLLLFIMTSIITGFYLLARSNDDTSYDTRSTSDILSELDELVEIRRVFINRREREADSLRRMFYTSTLPAEKIRLSFDLAMAEIYISTDSSIAAINRGFELALSVNDSISAERFVILRAKEYFFHGHIYEAFQDLEYAQLYGIHPRNWFIYHNTSKIIFITIAAFNDYQPFDGDLMKEGVGHALEEMSLLSETDPYYHFAAALAHMGRGEGKAMESALHKALALMDESHDIYHVANTVMGEYYHNIGDLDRAIRYYAIGAVTEVRKALLYEVAIMRLGEELTNTGDYSRAHRLLTVALENTLNSGSKFNLMRVSNAFVECAKQVERQKYERQVALVIAVVILAIFLAIIVKITIDKRRELESLRKAERQLSRSNLAKDTYIWEFMNLCSNYIESLDEYNRMCRRKIAAGQTDTLLEYIKSGVMLEQQRKKFYDVFDDAFLILFPDFVKQVNELIIPDKRFPEPYNVLTTELRLLALSRLGIDDSATIARVLGISTNTIYTYRNKMRSRAVNRNTFDEDVKRIDAV